MDVITPVFIEADPTSIIFLILEISIVIPAHDCMDAGGRETQEAKAEAGIHLTAWHDCNGCRIKSGMTMILLVSQLCC